MKFSTTIIAASVAALFSVAASAQSLESIEQRDLTQQRRIEQGLQSGQLTAREAARLESEANRVDRMQARALQDGRLSAFERERISAAQDRLGRDIYRESHDRQVADPNSRSSQRMQAEVRREISQDHRIAHAAQSGDLNNRDLGRMDWRASAGGRGGRYEERRFQYSDSRPGRDMRFERHDDNGRYVGMRDGQHNGRNYDSSHHPTTGATTGAAAGATSHAGYSQRSSQASSPRLVAQASVIGGQRTGGSRQR